MTRTQLHSALSLFLAIALGAWLSLQPTGRRASAHCPGYVAIREGDLEHLSCLDTGWTPPEGCQLGSPPEAGAVLTVSDTLPGGCRIEALPIAAERRLALGQRLDVNREPLGGLLAVPGIGPSLAAKIVQGRPYVRVEALERVRGIGPRTLRALERVLEARPGPPPS